MFSVTTTKKYWLSISGVIIIASLILYLTIGLALGIDFTGGSLSELRFTDGIRTHEQIKGTYEAVLGETPLIQDTDNGVLVRTKTLTESEHQEVFTKLLEVEGGNIEELRFESIGPSIGEELKQKSIKALIFVLIAIVLYVAWAFRHVSKPVASWKYGFIAISVLFHDVVIVVGIYVLLGKFFGIEVDAPFIAALLTVLGYSVNDTIVIFDRVRENLHEPGRTFDETVDASVRQSFTRSINTSATTLLVLLSILFFGGESVQSFVLALVIGVVIGTYSSLFLASPLLTLAQGKHRR